MYTFILFRARETTNKKDPPLESYSCFSNSLKLKAPSSIYLLGLAKNPWDRITMVSLDTTPQKIVWQHYPFGFPLFRVRIQCVFLGSHQYQKCPPPSSISHLQWHSWYYSYDPIPMSQVSFSAWSTLLSYFEQRKFESTTLPLPLFNSPLPAHSVG